MKIRDLVTKIAKEYVRKKHPDNVDAVDNYAVFFFSDMEVEEPPSVSERFTAVEAAEVILIPLILGVISNWLSELIRRRLSGHKSGLDIELSPDELQIIVHSDDEIMDDVQDSVIDRSESPGVAKEVVLFAREYIAHDGRQPAQDEENSNTCQ